jgi:hypothetical protein
MSGVPVGQLGRRLKPKPGWHEFAVHARVTSTVHGSSLVLPYLYERWISAKSYKPVEFFMTLKAPPAPAGPQDFGQAPRHVGDSMLWWSPGTVDTSTAVSRLNHSKVVPSSERKVDGCRVGPGHVAAERGGDALVDAQQAARLVQTRTSARPRPGRDHHHAASCARAQLAARRSLSYVSRDTVTCTL